ncbi:hypothetical protein [Photobacterium sp. DNB22_13_2]
MPEALTNFTHAAMREKPNADNNIYRKPTGSWLKTEFLKKEGDRALSIDGIETSAFVMQQESVIPNDNGNRCRNFA